MNETETKTETLDISRIEGLLKQILLPVRENYIKGPLGRDRAYEALNALATASALVITGCDGAQGEARQWFEQALEINLPWKDSRSELERVAFNLTQVKDLDYLLEIAARALFKASPHNMNWHERALAYRRLFHERMVELEKEAQA